MRTRTILMLAALGPMLLVASCTSPDVGHRTGPSPAPTATVPELHGIAVLISQIKSDNSATSKVAMFDDRTGKITRTLDAGDLTASWPATGAAISEDGTMVAAQSGQAITAVRLTPTGVYRKTGSWRPEQVEDPGDLVGPAFADNGRLYFVVSRVTYQETTHVVYSVDPTRSGDVPRREGRAVGQPGRGRKWDRYWDGQGRIAGRATLPVSGLDTVTGSGTALDVSATVLRSDHELVEALVTGKDRSGRHPRELYVCERRMSATVLLCRNREPETRRHPFEPWRGVVTTLSLSPDGSGVSLHRVVDTAPDQVETVLPARDGKRVLFETPAGWYEAPLDGSSEPEPAFEKLVLPDGVEWTDTTILGWY